MIPADEVEETDLKMKGERGDSSFSRDQLLLLPNNFIIFRLMRLINQRLINHVHHRPGASRLFNSRSGTVPKVGPVPGKSKEQIFRLARRSGLYYRSGEDTESGLSRISQLHDREICQSDSPETPLFYQEMARTGGSGDHRKNEIQDSGGWPDRETLLLPGTGLQDMEDQQGDGIEIPQSDSFKSRDGTPEDRDLQSPMGPDRSRGSDHDSDRKIKKEKDLNNSSESQRDTGKLENQTGQKMGILSVCYDQERRRETEQKKNLRRLVKQDTRQGRSLISGWIQSWEETLWPGFIYSHKLRYRGCLRLFRSCLHDRDKKISRVEGSYSERSSETAGHDDREDRSRTSGGLRSTTDQEPRTEPEPTDQDQPKNPPEVAPRTGFRSDLNFKRSEYLENIKSLADELVREGYS